MVRERNDGRERERDRQREARKRDRIGAILEEVINRCESKIDLFCSGSRPGDEPERTLCAASPHTHTHTHTRVRSYTCVRLYVYIYRYIPPSKRCSRSHWREQRARKLRVGASTRECRRGSHLSRGASARYIDCDASASSR